MTSVFAYSFDTKSVKLGLAQAHDVNASYKDLTQVCGAIKRQPLAKAKKILEDAIEGIKAIPYHKFNTGMGHRSNLGGKKGRYPKKECKIVLGLLQNAEANAGQKGLEKEKLFVSHAAAFKQNTFKRYRKFWVGGQTLGYGKQAIWANYQTARVELAVAQHGGGVSKAEAKDGKAEASAKEKKAKESNAAAIEIQKETKEKKAQTKKAKEKTEGAKGAETIEVKTDAKN